MALTPSVKIVKQMPFKDGTRQYSNRYHFNGGTPADATHWHTLFDNIVNAEKAIHHSTVTILEAIGYAAGSDVPVASKAYTTVGTGSFTGQFATGEAAALVRYATTARSSKNHPVYLFNYYHHIVVNSAANHEDELAAQYVTAMNTYAAAWIAGFSDGSITAVRAGPNGATATGYLTEQYATHRDFPYTRSE